MIVVRLERLVPADREWQPGVVRIAGWGEGHGPLGPLGVHCESCERASARRRAVTRGPRAGTCFGLGAMVVDDLAVLDLSGRAGGLHAG